MGSKRRVGLQIRLALGPDGWPSAFSNTTDVRQFSPYGRSGGQIGEPFHCFVDDWRIEVFWRRPEIGLAAAVCAGVCIGPDYSVFSNDPLPWARYQMWRSRVVEEYWRLAGVQVIPVLQWRDSSCSCLGIRPGSAVAVRGPSLHNASSWLSAFYHAVDLVKPSQVYLFGRKPPELSDVVHLPLLRRSKAKGVIVHGC